MPKSKSSRRKRHRVPQVSMMKMPQDPEFLALVRRARDAHRVYLKLVHEDPVLGQEGYALLLRVWTSLLERDWLDWAFWYWGTQDQLSNSEIESLRVTAQGMVQRRDWSELSKGDRSAYLLCLGLMMPEGAHRLLLNELNEFEKALALDLANLTGIEGTPLGIRAVGLPVHPMAFAALPLGKRYRLLRQDLPADFQDVEVKLQRLDKKLIEQGLVDRRVRLWPIQVSLAHPERMEKLLEWYLDQAVLGGFEWPALSSFFQLHGVDLRSCHFADVTAQKLLHAGLDLKLNTIKAAPQEAETWRIEKITQVNRGNAVRMDFVSDVGTLVEIPVPVAWLTLSGSFKETLGGLLHRYNRDMLLSSEDIEAVESVDLSPSLP